jgi:hypothetical protein
MFHRNEGATNLTSSLFLLIDSIRYVNRLFLAIDTNFRLKWRNVSSEAADPSFSTGWSYIVPETDYKAYLKQFSDLIVQIVSRRCPRLDWLSHINCFAAKYML